MNKKSIYTKKGDCGKTILVGGTEVLKSDERLDVFGSVDELNSILGMMLSIMDGDKIFDDIRLFIQRQQKNLFLVGSYIACEGSKRTKHKIVTIEKQEIKEIESFIDEIDSKIPPLQHFIFPGGSVLASWGHLARAMCRQVERKAVVLREIQNDYLDENILMYLNRLSDGLFCLSRYFNIRLNSPERIWPGSP